MGNIGGDELNDGKKFEEDFKKSVKDEGVFYLRLKDGGGWSNADNTRFTASNECDCILYDELDMYMLEFKSHKGKSIPLSCIRENQLKSLIEAQTFRIISGFVFNFRDLPATYFVTAERVGEYIAEFPEKKSIPIKWCAERGIEIAATKKISRYSYDIKGFCERSKPWI